MKLLPSLKETRNLAFIVMTAVAIASCQKAVDPRADSPVRISLCDLFKNPAAHDQKIITVSGTITQLPNGKYLYPGSTGDCNYSLVKVDTDHVQSMALTELESSTTSPAQRPEFDLELTGIFDAKYYEGREPFRYRIVPTSITPQSPVRIGKPLGAP